MAVREARPEDVQDIQRVAEESWHAAHDSIVGRAAVDEFLTSHYNEAEILSGVTDAETLYYVAEDDAEELVGFIAGGPWRDSETTYVVGALYVTPSRWRQGFGRRLLQRFETEVRTRGGKQVRLVVMAKNEDAVEFYESASYEHTDDNYDEELDVHGRVYVKDLLP